MIKEHLIPYGRGENTVVPRSKHMNLLCVRTVDCRFDKVCEVFKAGAVALHFINLYAFFWVITRRLEFKCRRFGTLCSIFIGR